MVAPNSGDILLMVALSATDRFLTPGPKNYTNLSTTPLFLSNFVQYNTRSVEVVCNGN
jgi:hypothetical protein